MPPIHTRSLPYCADSARYMRALDELGTPAFLDSACHGGANGRKDILAAAPIAFMKIESGVFSCSENVESAIDHSTDMDVLLRNIRYLKDLFIPKHELLDSEPTIPEHAGSVIACLGYPTLKSKANLSLSDAFVGIYTWTVIVDHEQRMCEFRAHPACPAASIDQTFARIEQALTTTADKELAEFIVEHPFYSDTSRDQYQQAFTEIKSRIASGDCYQVNLTQRYTTKAAGDPLTAYLKLRESTSAPFSAFMNWNSGALLSLSPERFISLRQDTVLTQPVKGTRPRGVTQQEDARLAAELAMSEKDQAENLMIVDLLRNDLGRICKTGSIQVNQIFKLESFSNVHHLVSTITGKLPKDRDALDLIANCYPGGSITGAPKLAAMERIQEVELNARRLYCGTVFYLDTQGNFDSSITIRSLAWQSGTLNCWAGGGIVADSDCAQEYQECMDKIGNIFSSLQELAKA